MHSSLVLSIHLALEKNYSRIFIFLIASELTTNDNAEASQRESRRRHLKKSLKFDDKLGLDGYFLLKYIKQLG